MKTLAERSYALWRGSPANPHDAPHWLDLTNAQRDSYIAVSRHIPHSLNGDSSHEGYFDQHCPRARQPV